MVPGQVKMVRQNKKMGDTPKQRREHVNSSAKGAKDELPLSQKDSESLSQLQTLHYLATYIIKEQSFINFNLKKSENDFIVYHNKILQQILFNQATLSETLPGFIIVLSPRRNLIYVSENVFQYLGLTAVEVLLSCDSLEEVLHPNDEKVLYEIFERSYSKEEFEFLCSWNASKIKRRVHSNADAKIFKINGRFVENGTLFVATCTPMLRSINKEYLTATSPHCFTSVHNLDLKFLELCEKGQNILDYTNHHIIKNSLYDIYHSKDLDLIRKRHKNLLNTKSQKGKIDLVKVLKRDGTYINCLINLYYSPSNVIICNYQLLSENDVNSYEKYMNSLTKSIKGADGADSLAESGHDIDTQSGLLSIDSSSNEEFEFDRQYSAEIFFTNNQTPKKRKIDEDLKNEANATFINNKNQRLSVDIRCSSITNEQISPNYVQQMQFQNIATCDFNNKATNFNLTPSIQFIQTPVSTVQLHENENENFIYPTLQNSFTIQNQDFNYTEQTSYIYDLNHQYSPSSLCSEIENSSIENTTLEVDSILYDLLNNDSYNIDKNCKDFTLPDLSNEYIDLSDFSPELLAI